MSSEPPTLPPPPAKHKRTKYMKQVERNKIRQMILDGFTQTQIADKLKLSDRQIRNYTREIRQQDYDHLSQQDDTARAQMLQMSIDEAARLKMHMLSIVFAENSSNHEKILAAQEARQFNMDIVNLSINGPNAFNSNNYGTAKRYLPGVREEETDSIPLSGPDSTTDETPTNWGSNT